MERKNRTSVEGSKGILPDTENGREVAPTSNVLNALRAASEQSRSEECLLLRDDTDDALLDMCSTSKPEECEGEDELPELRLEVDDGEERTLALDAGCDMTSKEKGVARTTIQVGQAGLLIWEASEGPDI